MKRHECTLATLVGAGLLSLGCSRVEPEPRTAPPKADVASTALPAKAPAPRIELESRTRGWELGKRYTYRLRSSTAVAFAEGAPSFDFDISGELQIVATSASENDVTLYLFLPDARVVNRGARSRADVEGLAAELGGTGAFVRLSGGRTVAFDIPKDASDMAASTYRQLGAALQFARPQGEAPAYTAEEYDTTGKYVVEYAHLPGARTWTKQKRSYVELLGGQGLPGDSGIELLPKVIASKGDVRLSPEGRPESIQLEDEVGMKGTQVPLRSRLRLELETTGVRALGATDRDLEGLLARTRRVAANAPLHPARSDESLDEARIGGLDFETVVAELEQRGREREEKARKQRDESDAEATPPTGDESEVQRDSRRFIALAAMLRSDARLVSKAVARIRAKSKASGDLLDALSSASSPEAQRALAGLVGMKGVDADLRANVVFSLSRLRTPTREATRALESVLDDDPIHTGALYGLGTHARLYRDLGNAKEATRLGERLLTHLARADGSSARATVLRAIANSGYDGALAAVSRQLKDAHDEVRAPALRALQSMRTPRADALLAHHITDDESKKARLSAIEAADLREPSEVVVAALSKAATDADDPHVRFRSVELLVRWLPRRPDVRGALERVAKADEEVKVRELAKAAL
jgi:hypothetical protein